MLLSAPENAIQYLDLQAVILKVVKEFISLNSSRKDDFWCIEPGFCANTPFILVCYVLY